MDISVFVQLLNKTRRAAKGYSVAQVQEAAEFALTAFKMHLRGWRTNTWHLPAKEGKTHDCSIFFWDEPAIKLGGRQYTRARRDSWQPNRHSTSWGKWFKSIWAAVAFAEEKADRKVAK
jgi:hypothetical protein